MGEEIAVEMQTHHSTEVLSVLRHRKRPEQKRLRRRVERARRGFGPRVSATYVIHLPTGKACSRNL